MDHCLRLHLHRAQYYDYLHKTVYKVQGDESPYSERLLHSYCGGTSMCSFNSCIGKLKLIQFLALCQTIAMTIAEHYGLGRKRNKVSSADFESFQKVFFTHILPIPIMLTQS